MHFKLGNFNHMASISKVSQPPIPCASHSIIHSLCNHKGLREKAMEAQQAANTTFNTTLKTQKVFSLTGEIFERFSDTSIQNLWHQCYSYIMQMSHRDPLGASLNPETCFAIDLKEGGASFFFRNIKEVLNHPLTKFAQRFFLTKQLVDNVLGIHQYHQKRRSFFSVVQISVNTTLALIPFATAACKNLCSEHTIVTTSINGASIALLCYSIFSDIVLLCYSKYRESSPSVQYINESFNLINKKNNH